MRNLSLRINFEALNVGVFRTHLLLIMSNC